MSPQAAAHARTSAAAPHAQRTLDETHTEVLRLDLRDIPYMSQGLHIEGLKPSLLSRFVGLFVR